ncbi:MAG: PHB depolymerase family esterase [Ktedonobacteraceae bacterium]|nr:PHB depolymerase family esterase [Ktedonobacteraceae bacterium]
MWQQYTYRAATGSLPYFVYTPEHYQVGTPVPLFVLLHGCTQTAADFAAATRMNQLAEIHNFIVVYPQQVSRYNHASCWNWFLPANQVRASGEPAAIAGIVQAVREESARWTIDADRIYVAGFSAGGSMAVILGATYPDIFAAIAVHSGVEYQAASNVFNAMKAMRQGGPDPSEQGQAAYRAMGNVARVVPVIVFQGLSDETVVPLNGNQVVQQWLQTDALASNGTYVADFAYPTSVTAGRVPGGHSYVRATWNASNGMSVQEYWQISGMGHAWSGGVASTSYTDPSGPDASLAIYLFFMAHPRSRRFAAVSAETAAQAHRSFLHTLANFLRTRREKQKHE